jgi:hypothetical protein
VKGDIYGLKGKLILSANETEELIISDDSKNNPQTLGKVKQTLGLAV